MYAGIEIDVAMLQEVHANEGSDSVAVVDYAKIWALSGQFLASGDQVTWYYRLISNSVHIISFCVSHKWTFQSCVFIFTHY